MPMHGRDELRAHITGGAKKNFCLHGANVLPRKMPDNNNILINLERSVFTGISNFSLDAL